MKKKTILLLLTAAILLTGCGKSAAGTSTASGTDRLKAIPDDKNMDATLEIEYTIAHPSGAGDALLYGEVPEGLLTAGYRIRYDIKSTESLVYAEGKETYIYSPSGERSQESMQKMATWTETGEDGTTVYIRSAEGGDVWYKQALSDGMTTAAERLSATLSVLKEGDIGSQSVDISGNDCTVSGRMSVWKLPVMDMIAAAIPSDTDVDADVDVLFDGETGAFKSATIFAVTSVDLEDESLPGKSDLNCRVTITLNGTGSNKLEIPADVKENAIDMDAVYEYDPEEMEKIYEEMQEGDASGNDLSGKETE